MKKSKLYEMNGKQYSSMMDIARELGKKRVYPKDFEKLGVKVIDLENIVETKPVEYQQLKLTDVKSDTPKVKSKATKPKPKATKPVNSTKPVKRRVKSTKRVGTSEEIIKALEIATRVSVDEFSDYIKHFSLKSLIKLAKKADVRTWDKIENEAIRKMRILMSLKRHFYPTTSTVPRKSSQWKNVPLQSLVDYATNLGLLFRVSDNEHIQRMWVINALNTAGITPVDLLGVDLGVLNLTKNKKRCENNTTHLH